MHKKVLIIGLVWPEPSSSAAGTRMLQLIRFFISRHYHVTFASAAQRGDFSFPLDGLGVASKDILLNDSSFDAFVKQLVPDIVMFDRYITEEQFGWRVAGAVPDALRILDTEDLHCLRIAREHAMKKALPFHISDLLESDIAIREIASICRSDLSLIISRFEIGVLNEVFNVDGRLLHYLPFLFDPITDKDAEAWPGFDERSGYLFIGNFFHYPNIDAVYFLKNEIWPRIRNLQPDSVIRVYGAYIPEKVMRLHDPASGFLIEGRTGDVARTMLSARVMLAPLRIGAGQKGKLAEAMQNGLPSVTTSIGAEGMSTPEQWNGLVADDTGDFVQSAVLLYDNRDIWEEKRAKGRSCFDVVAWSEEKDAIFDALLASLAGRLVEHRRENFTGKMLRHHTMVSHRYLSRWIEEKNKDK